MLFNKGPDGTNQMKNLPLEQPNNVMSMARSLHVIKKQLATAHYEQQNVRMWQLLAHERQCVLTLFIISYYTGGNQTSTHRPVPVPPFI